MFKLAAEEWVDVKGARGCTGRTELREEHSGQRKECMQRP